MSKKENKQNIATKMKEIKLKEPKPIDCSNCKFLCSRNFPEDLRAEICKSFWMLGDYRRQKDFILMNVKSSSPKRRRPSREPTEKSKTRTNSKSFFLLSKRVCQSFFLKTLAISNGPLIKAFEHKNVYTNFFDGDDKRGKHTPANKLGSDVVESVVSHLEQFTVRNARSKKRIITDPEIRSLRHLFCIYGENKDGGASSLSYTSFKRIFNDHNFAFPPDRVRNRPVGKTPRLEPKNEVEEMDIKYIDERIFEEEVVEPKVIVTQIPDSKFFSNPSQVYEIQFIEIPINNQT